MPEFKLVLGNELARDAIFNAFVNSKVTVLTEEKNPTRIDLMVSATKSDLTIKVQEATFLGHQKILSVNPVFKTTTPTSTATDNKVPSLSIPDFNPETFEIFLKHIYGHKVENENISVELMKLAHQYVDSKLTKICEDHLVSTICEDNAVELLFLGADIESEKIIQEASKFITDEYEEINIRDDFEKYQQHPKVVDAIFKVVEPIIKSTTEKCKQLEDENKKLRDQNSNLQPQNQDSLYVVRATYSNVFSLNLPVEPEVISATRFYLKRVAFSVYIDLSLKDTEKAFGIYLRCLDDADTFQHRVSFTLSLLSRRGERNDINRKQTSVFEQSKREFGWPKFCPYQNLRIPSTGFIHDDMIIKVKVRAQYLE